MGFVFARLFFSKLKKFYDIVGSFRTVVLYTFFSSYISSGFNIGNFIISSLIIIWALRLGSFLFFFFFFFFFKNLQRGERIRFKFIPLQLFFMTWTLQGMWVSVCSLSALTAMSSPTGVVVNECYSLGYPFLFFGLLLEIMADQKTQFRNKPENKGILSVLVYGRIQDIQIMLVKLCYGQVFL